MVKVALIGLGSMGQNHYRVLKGLTGFEITALCDIQQTKDYDEPFYTDLDEMLEKAEFDAAVIVVPTFLHKEVAIKCLNKGKHLFI
ncbi:Gfo/Idh/MocA family oxidoreductase, partial [Sulfurospirillum sp.]|nr:Gfo/Idh/MocA family oxidoreductase [Sulfurospirillum sp.]